MVGVKSRRKSIRLILDKSEFERSAKEQYIQVFDNCELRTLSFETVRNPSEDIEIMFIPGLLPIFPRWEKN